jgi:hypothetical protein
MSETQMDGRLGCPSIARRTPRLEAEPELKLCDPSGKGAEGAPKVSCVCEIGVASTTRLKRRQVKNVEEIEEVGPNFQVSGFAEM